jgi:hypothetical protein
MLIRNQETGLSLGSAPEFGKNAEPPPVTSDWVPIRWELFDVPPTSIDCSIPYSILKVYRKFAKDSNIADPLLTGDALNVSEFCEEVFSHTSAQIESVDSPDRVNFWINTGTTTLSGKARVGKFPPWGFLVGVPDRTEGELRKLVHSIRWKRKDPVVQLAPGSTREEAHSITTGLSVEHSLMLAQSLGLNIGGESPGIQTSLSSQLQQQYGLKIQITNQCERSTKSTLSNPEAGQYRLYALWHVEHRITVDSLCVPVSKLSSSGIIPVWDSQTVAEFTVEVDNFVMTYAERRIVSN